MVRRSDSARHPAIVTKSVVPSRHSNHFKKARSTKVPPHWPPILMVASSMRVGFDLTTLYEMRSTVPPPISQTIKPITGAGFRIMHSLAKRMDGVDSCTLRFCCIDNVCQSWELSGVEASLVDRLTCSSLGHIRPHGRHCDDECRRQCSSEFFTVFLVEILD